MGFTNFMTSVFDSLFKRGAEVDSASVPTAPHEDDRDSLDLVDLFRGFGDDSERPNGRAPNRVRSSAANGEEIGHTRGSVSTAARSDVGEVTEAPKPYCFTQPPATRSHDYPDGPVAPIETSNSSEA